MSRGRGLVVLLLSQGLMGQTCGSEGAGGGGTRSEGPTGAPPCSAAPAELGGLIPQGGVAVYQITCPVRSATPVIERGLTVPELVRDSVRDFTIESTSVRALSQLYFHPRRIDDERYTVIVEADASAPLGAAKAEFRVVYPVDGVELANFGELAFEIVPPRTPPAHELTAGPSQLAPGDTTTLVAKSGAPDTALAYLTLGLTPERSRPELTRLEGGQPTRYALDGTDAVALDRLELVDAPEASRAYQVLALARDGAATLLQTHVDVAGTTLPLAVELRSVETPPIYVGETIRLRAATVGGVEPYTYTWEPALGTTPDVTVTVPETTTYSVRVTDAAGATATASLAVRPVRDEGSSFDFAIHVEAPVSPTSTSRFSLAPQVAGTGGYEALGVVHPTATCSWTLVHADDAPVTLDRGDCASLIFGAAYPPSPPDVVLQAGVWSIEVVATVPADANGSALRGGTEPAVAFVVTDP